MDKQQQAQWQPPSSTTHSSSNKKRYSATLNAPTTAGNALGDQLTSYVDRETVYHLSILDTTPVRDQAHQYHSVVRVCLDDGPPESYHRQDTTTENSVNLKICTIEYAPFLQKSGGSAQTLPILHTSLERSFSVTWSSSSVTGGSYCLIPIRFRNFSTPGDVALKLFVGTERIQIIDATLSHAEQYEESYGCIRLFSGGDAQKTYAAETADIEHRIVELQRGTDHAKIAPFNAPLAQPSANGGKGRHENSEQHPKRKRKAPTDAKHATTCTIGHASLLDNLSAARRKLSAIRPVQVFRPVVSVHGQHPESHLPSQQIKYSSPVAQFEQNVNGSKRTHTPSTSAYNTVEKRQEYDYSSNSNANLEVPLKTTVTLRRRRSSPGESPK